MRILFLTKYSRNGASSRYRVFQYLPDVKHMDIEYEVSSLFDDSYLANKYYNGRGSKLEVVRAFMRRIKAFLGALRFDLVVIEYEILPYSPAIFERILSWVGIRYVVDYDDALFHQYDRHRNPIVKSLLGKKIAVVMRHAELVVTGNQYLASYARKVGAKHVEIIPTVIDLDRYPSPVETADNAIFTVGWIGSPSTAKYLKSVASALVEVFAEEKAKLKLIGSGVFKLPCVDMEILPWTEEKEVEQIYSFDVGIMPLPDEPWARGKCGFKLIQYMACGLPVIASPVGVNCEIVEHGVNGFLAETKEEWMQALITLRNDPTLRRAMGLAGRKKVEEQYCLQITAPKLTSLLQSVAIKDQ